MPEVKDETWAEVATLTRDALALLGRHITSRCLPGEPDYCGGSFAQHSLAHLAALKAVADHQLAHLGGPVPMISEIYRQELAELEKGCGRHA